MGLCYFCEKNDRECYTGYYCNECKKLQRILKLYGDDVYKTNDTVFIRNSKQQQYKIDTMNIKAHIKVDELDEKQDKDGYNLRNKRP
tara:strand:- start:158 stop:418 length:261 start_codon:yes stop_codon:yes gene_type:complete